MCDERRVLVACIVDCRLSNAISNQDLQISCDQRDRIPVGVMGRVFTADTVDAHNAFDAPNVVELVAFDGVRIKNGQLEIGLPAKSVVALAVTVG